MKTNQVSGLNPLKFALAAAIIISFTIFVTTLLSLFNIVETLPTLTLIISNFYGNFGYSVSFLGSLLGALYGFIDTFILAYIFAWLYNKML